jgi:hypothetical protein
VIRTPDAVLFQGTVSRSRKVMEATLAERGDPKGIYTAEVTVTLPSSSSAPAAEAAPAADPAPKAP